MYGNPSRERFDFAGRRRWTGWTSRAAWPRPPPQLLQDLWVDLAKRVDQVAPSTPPDYAAGVALAGERAFGLGCRRARG